jgi:anti-anti-sigma factor
MAEGRDRLRDLPESQGPSVRNQDAKRFLELGVRSRHSVLGGYRTHVFVRHAPPLALAAGPVLTYTSTCGRPRERSSRGPRPQPPVDQSATCHSVARTEEGAMRGLARSSATPLRPINGIDLHPSTLAKLEDQTPRDAAGMSQLPSRDDLRSRLTILGQSRGRVERLELSGHLGIRAAPIVHVWLAQAENASMALVVLDLRNVTSMDEAGFLICLRAWGHAKLRGMRLRLVRCRADVMRLLDLTGTAELFGALPTTDGRLPEYEGAGWTPILIPQVCRDQ